MADCAPIGETDSWNCVPRGYSVFVEIRLPGTGAFHKGLLLNEYSSPSVPLDSWTKIASAHCVSFAVVQAPESRWGGQRKGRRPGEGVRLEGRAGRSAPSYGPAWALRGAAAATSSWFGPPVHSFRETPVHLNMEPSRGLAGKFTSTSAGCLKRKIKSGI